MWSRIGHLIALAALASLAQAGCGPPPPEGPREPLVGAEPAAAIVGCRDEAAAYPAEWAVGTDCANEAPIQVHRYDPDTVILRQSVCSHFEAPFMYLLAGQKRALLLDTGAGGAPVVETAAAIVEEWAARRGAPLELVVVNSHAHGDHVAGNAAFAARPATVVVGTTVAGISAFFGMTDWPRDPATIDLGGRVIDVLAIPGHEASHLALYDRATGLLFTGDTLYPGRLYVRDLPAYKASVARLVRFAGPRTICGVLGAHIEMTAEPGVDFAMEAPAHPGEHRLQLGREHLLELSDALGPLVGRPGRTPRDDFIIVVLDGR